MAMMKEKIGVVGSMVQTEKRREHPKLHIFGVSYNSAKANLALRMSSAWPGATIRMMDIAGTNYKPEYMRLNPNATVPTCEIDDKIICDSNILCEYLQEKHPGIGDKNAIAAGKGAEMNKYCALVQTWDEGMYTYGIMAGEKGGGMGAMMNALRNIRLRQYYSQLPEASKSEKVHDGRTLKDAYEQKIAYIMNLSSKVDCGMTPEKKAAFDKNETMMENLFTESSRLINAAGGNGFLFGPDLTTPDAYFGPVLFRVASMDKPGLDAICTKYPALKGYWQRFCQNEDCKQAVTKFTMGWASRFSLTRCIPCAMIGVKAGCVKAPPLPADVDERINKLSV